ncbi:MAG: CorA family divalent cation transporter [Planctomycetota bacterium]
MKKLRKAPLRVGRTLGHAFDATVDTAFGSVSHALHSTLRLTGLAPRRGGDSSQAPHAAPGAVPGLEGFADRNTPPPPGLIKLTVHDYGPESLDVHHPEDIETLFAAPRPENAVVRWINIDGLHPWVVKQFVETHGMHTLAAEDTLHVPQRPKAEAYDDHLFLVARMMRLHEEKLSAEQVSMFLKPGLLVTFQENADESHKPATCGSPCGSG